MAEAVENLKIELLTNALYETGNGDKVEEINRILIEFISKGKVQTNKTSKLKEQKNEEL